MISQRFGDCRQSWGAIGGGFGFGGAQGEGGLEPQWSVQDKAARPWEWGSGEMDAGNPPRGNPAGGLELWGKGSVHGGGGGNGMMGPALWLSLASLQGHWELSEPLGTPWPAGGVTGCCGRMKQA